MLRTRLFSTSAFERMICSPVTLRRRVLLMPICSTVPSMSSMRRLSPIAKGLSSAIDIEPNRSPSMRLHRQRDRDAADAQAGDQRRDVDAEVVQREQHEDRPDEDLPDEHQRRPPARARIRTPARLWWRSMKKRSAVDAHSASWIAMPTTMIDVEHAGRAPAAAVRMFSAKYSAMLSSTSWLVRFAISRPSRSSAVSGAVSAQPAAAARGCARG